VSGDSPADKAGIVAGDIILALSGATVNTLDDFYKRLWSSGAPAWKSRSRSCTDPT
jgi:S1-C subfamily serine protease